MSGRAVGYLFLFPMQACSVFLIQNDNLNTVKIITAQQAKCLHAAQLNYVVYTADNGKFIMAKLGQTKKQQTQSVHFYIY